MKLEYKILKEKVREYNKKDAQFYGNIFAKMNKVEQAKSSIIKQAIRRKLNFFCCGALPMRSPLTISPCFFLF